MWQPLLQRGFDVLIAITIVAMVLHALFDWNPLRTLARSIRKLVPARTRPSAEHRPIEQIAHDGRRLWWRFHQSQRGLSRAKQVALQRAYDDVLGEGCGALGLPHLLAVLPPGPELDGERERVEDLLECAGLRLRQLH